MTQMAGWEECWNEFEFLEGGGCTILGGGYGGFWFRSKLVLGGMLINPRYCLFLARDLAHGMQIRNRNAVFFALSFVFDEYHSISWLVTRLKFDRKEKILISASIPTGVGYSYCSYRERVWR